MTATQTTDTVENWLTHMANDHYLSVAAQNTSPADDTELGWVVWDGPGDEDYVLTTQPSNQDLTISAGYNANTSSQSAGGDYDQRIWQNTYDQWTDSYSNIIDWLTATGTDWFWDVHVFEGSFTEDAIVGLGYQTVNQSWDYTIGNSASSIAVLQDSHDEDSYSGDGWADQNGYCWARVDSSQRSGEGPSSRLDSAVVPQTGGLTAANTWRTSDVSILTKDINGRQIIGTIDAWGWDPSTTTPTHLDTFDVNSKTYQYINPGAGWSDGDRFFRVA